MPSLRNQYEAMPVQQLEDLLSTSVLDARAINLCRSVINERLKEQRYAIDPHPNSTGKSSDPRESQQSPQPKTAWYTFSGVVFCGIGSFIFSLFLLIPNVFLGAGGGILLPIGSLLLLWTASSRISWWPILSGSIFFFMGLIFFAGSAESIRTAIAILVGTSLVV